MMRPSSFCHRGAAVLLAVTVASGCATSLPLARVEPVTIHARGDSASIDAFAASIDAALAEIAGRLELPIPARGLEVYLFDSGWEMRSFLRDHCPEQSGKAAACFSRPRGFAVTAVKSSQPGNTDRMLRHELTHYLLASHFRDLPRWIDEGLAQYLEVDPYQPRRDKRRQFTEQKIRSTEEAIAELISLPPSQPLGKAQYLLSWAFVSFLVQEERIGMARIKYYLAQVEADGNLRSHFESSFGSLDGIRPGWNSFLEREILAPVSASENPFRRFGATLVPMDARIAVKRGEQRLTTTLDVRKACARS